MRKLYCKKCGEKVNLQVHFCNKCGMKFKMYDIYDTFNTQDIRSIKYRDPIIIKKFGPFNRNTAILICLFGGPVGLHKFYERNYKSGFIYMFTFGKLCFGWISDLINLSKMPKNYYAFKIIKMEYDG